MRYHAFASFNSRDRDAVAAVCAALESFDVRVWIDDRDMDQLGAGVTTALFASIDRCDHLLVFIGPHGLGPVQEDEINHGFLCAQQTGGAFRLIPVFLDGAKPPRWTLARTGVRWVGAGSASARSLVATLKGEAGGLAREDLAVAADVTGIRIGEADLQALLHECFHHVSPEGDARGTLEVWMVDGASLSNPLRIVATAATVGRDLRDGANARRDVLLREIRVVGRTGASEAVIGFEACADRPMSTRMECRIRPPRADGVIDQFGTLAARFAPTWLGKVACVVEPCLIAACTMGALICVSTWATSRLMGDSPPFIWLALSVCLAGAGVVWRRSKGGRLVRARGLLVRLSGR